LSKIIPEEELAACQPWLVPEMGKAGPGRKGPLTAGQLEALQEHARIEGFNQGLEEGRAAGAEQVRRHVARLEALIAGLARPADDLDADIEAQLAQLAMLVAKQLVRRELKTDQGQVVAVVREALGLLPLASRHVRLSLHPDDVALVRDALSVHEDIQSVSIIQNPAQRRGGCRVETDTSRIDATVETRINAVIAGVLGGERNGDE